MIPAERHRLILEQLQQKRTVRIRDLANTLGVSAMTIHRDLNQLASDGLLHKVRGGARLEPAPGQQRATCFMCHGPVSQRHLVSLQFADGSQAQACCPHCGLMAMNHNRVPVEAAMTTDYIHGRKVNVRQAFFLIAPDLSICCTPTILAFGNFEDAQRFQAGFGGRVLQLGDALRHLQQTMTMEE